MNCIKFPVSDTALLKKFRAGEEVMVDGVIYTARDKVHNLVSTGKAAWPFELKANALFYCGPTAPREGFPFGSAGPTTSSRMDSYTSVLYREGLAATIGKGPRSEEVVRAVKESGGLYLSAYGGCGALYGSRIIAAELLDFKELGPQAVYKLEVRDFPVIVAIDSRGKNIFKGEGNND